MIRRDTYSSCGASFRRGRPPARLLAPAAGRALRRGTGARLQQIALGHHRDDLVETLLLSALYSGALRSMPPRLRAADGKNVVIRPLCYAPEEEIAESRRRCASRWSRATCAAPSPISAQAREGAAGGALGGAPGGEGEPAPRLARVVPSHLLDRALAARLEAATGQDPWIDDEEDACGEPEGEVVKLSDGR